MHFFGFIFKLSGEEETFPSTMRRMWCRLNISEREEMSRADALHEMHHKPPLMEASNLDSLLGLKLDLGVRSMQGQDDFDI